jgi:hypothetical protein
LSERNLGCARSTSSEFRIPSQSVTSRNELKFQWSCSGVFSGDKIGFLWINLGTQCGSHPEFPGQQESEWISELRKLWFRSVFRGPEAMMRSHCLLERDLIGTSLLIKC